MIHSQNKQTSKMSMSLFVKKEQQEQQCVDFDYTCYICNTTTKCTSNIDKIKSKIFELMYYIYNIIYSICYYFINKKSKFQIIDIFILIIKIYLIIHLIKTIIYLLKTINTLICFIRSKNIIVEELQPPQPPQPPQQPQPNQGVGVGVGVGSAAKHEVINLVDDENDDDDDDDYVPDEDNNDDDDDDEDDDEDDDDDDSNKIDDDDDKYIDTNKPRVINRTSDTYKIKTDKIQIYTKDFIDVITPTNVAHYKVQHCVINGVSKNYTTLTEIIVSILEYIQTINDNEINVGDYLKYINYKNRKPNTKEKTAGYKYHPKINSSIQGTNNFRAVMEIVNLTETFDVSIYTIIEHKQNGDAIYIER